MGVGPSRDSFSGVTMGPKHRDDSDTPSYMYSADSESAQSLHVPYNRLMRVAFILHFSTLNILYLSCYELLLTCKVVSHYNTLELSTTCARLRMVSHFYSTSQPSKCYPLLVHSVLIAEPCLAHLPLLSLEWNTGSR